jgi:hypothetical protein
MKKYLLFVPLVGIIVPAYMDDWDDYVKKNPIKFNISLIIQMISFCFMFVIHKVF